MLKGILLFVFGFACIALIAVGVMTLVKSRGTTNQAMQPVTNTELTQLPDDGTETGVLVGGSVMLPTKTIVDNAKGSSDHTTLVTAVTAAGLAETLMGAGPFTVFAPNNAAFALLPAGTVETLLKPENKETLIETLSYHVVSGAYTVGDITDGLQLTTVQGQKITFTYDDGGWLINGEAKIVIDNIVSSNGVTHVIDHVLLPN